MKYLTKEWYHDLQHTFDHCGFEIIPDKNYSDADIRKLYQKKLEKEVAEDQKDYDSPPCFLFGDDLTADSIEPEDFVLVDEKTGKMTRNLTKEQIRESLLAQKKAAMEAFEARPPFDPAETVDRVRQCYRSHLRSDHGFYPAWLFDIVDKRLIALQMIPKNAYDRLKTESQQLDKREKAIVKAAEAAMKKQNIPSELSEALCLHDACLLSLRKVGNNIVMIVKKDGMWPEDKTPYRQVVFRDAVFLEKDPGLRVRKTLTDEGHTSRVTFLYHELYRTPTGWEAHMLFWQRSDLAYLTIACRSIRYRDGIAYG